MYWIIRFLERVIIFETLQNQDNHGRIILMEETAKQFKETAREHAQKVSVPFESVEMLNAIGYPALSIPKEDGGGGISLVELMKHQESSAMYDGATALSIGWHMGIIMDLGEKKTWDEAKYKKVRSEEHTSELQSRGHLVCRLLLEK